MFEKNKVYWTQKDQRADKARSHTEEMSTCYADEIKQAIEKTTTHRIKDEPIIAKAANNTLIKVLNTDSVSGIIQEHENKTAVLNFASYKFPGGMFIQGSMAQEEALCHESFLYNVLKEKEEYYAENNKKLNKALYMNALLYTPDVRFFKNGDTCLCDVITCAAPNFTTAYKYQQVSREENNTILYDRIDFVLAIAAKKNVDTLILGAWGCGVFGQDPRTVAEYFKELLQKYNFKKVIFAIPGDFHCENLIAFQEVFNN